MPYDISFRYTTYNGILLCYKKELNLCFSFKVLFEVTGFCICLENDKGKKNLDSVYSVCFS